MREGKDDYGSVTATFYDAAYGAKADLGTDISFYKELARETSGPVLELGCGTGRVLLPILDDGHMCTGVDTSAEMLAAFRAKTNNPRLTLVHAHMQEFDLGNVKFALILSAFRAFQHMYTVDDQLACLERVRAHLNRGGTFAFDVFHPKLDRIAQGDEAERQDLAFELGDERVGRYTTVTRNTASQIMNVMMRYERRREGQVVGNEIAEVKMRWFYRYELEHLMRRAGFDRVEIYGDFDRSAIVPDSPNYVILAG